MSDARLLIEKLRLSAHPEGGWYRETWRAETPPGRRASASAILFLLDAGERSNWHRVDAAELWLWHAGAPIELDIATDETSRPEPSTLGPDVLRGQSPQVIVPAYQWQTARADTGWALVSCIVSPGFDFAGFALGARDWIPGPHD